MLYYEPTLLDSLPIGACSQLVRENIAVAEPAMG